MNKLFRLITVFLFAASLNSCSKKSHPSRTTVDSEKSTKTEAVKTPAVEKKEAKKPEVVFPKVITVNDSAARKSVDGRMYYDVMGHRYWRNNKDGKYYLFNKSMYNNPDFKAQN